MTGEEAATYLLTRATIDMLSSPGFADLLSDDGDPRTPEFGVGA